MRNPFWIWITFSIYKKVLFFLIVWLGIYININEEIGFNRISWVMIHCLSQTNKLWMDWLLKYTCLNSVQPAIRISASTVLSYQKKGIIRSACCLVLWSYIYVYAYSYIFFISNFLLRWLRALSIMNLAEHLLNTRRREDILFKIILLEASICFIPLMIRTQKLKIGGEGYLPFKQCPLFTRG